MVIKGGYEMRKKLLSLFLAFTLLTSLMVPSAFAAGNALSVDKNTVSEGETVTVSFTQPKTQQISGYDLSVAFDKTAFEAVSVVEMTSLTDPAPDVGAINRKGAVNLGYASSTGSVDEELSGKLFAVSFKALKSGTFEFKIAEYGVAGEYNDETYAAEDITPSDAEIGTKTLTVTVKAAVTDVPVESVSLDKTELKLAKGGNAKLTATVNPADATDKTVTWTTSDNKVATVAADGTVTAVGEGTAVITATAGGKTAQCTVTVVNCLHSSKSFVAAKAATCTEKGMKAHYKCDNCSALFETATSTTPVAASTLELPMIDHTFTDVAEKAATCTEKGNVAYKHCTTCNKNYDAEGKLLDTVETPAKGHAPEAEFVWANDKTQHWKVCPDCNGVMTIKVDHTWDANGICTVCKYGCAHTDGTLQWVAKDKTTHEQKWSCCGTVVKTEDHTWNDGVCTVCGYECHHDQASPRAHNDTDHWQVCTYCHKEFHKAAHNGGKATCKEKATCVVCGAKYGELAGHNFDTKWTSDDTYHYHKCLTAGCTEKADDAAKHSSTGANEANCLHKAKCDVCAAEYGNLGAHTLTKTAAKAPTCLEPGNNEYYTCSVCGKVFKDAAGTTETTVAAETLAKSTTHSVVKGEYATSATEHWQICKVCGTVVGKAAHKFGEADANGRKTCADCGYTVGGTGTEGHKHAAGNATGYDENNHWNKCTDANCDAHVNETKHTFTTVSTTKEGNTTITVEQCQCGYVKRTETTTGGTTPVNPGGNKPTKPGTKDNGKTVQSGKTFDAGVGVYVGLSILSLTGSAVVIGKKRKTR